MRPPICSICEKEFEPAEGGLVYFQKQPSDIEWDRRSEEEGFTDHPPYCDWFCKEHYEKAFALSHLPIHEAMKLLKGDTT